MAGEIVTARLRRAWPGEALQLEALQPAGSHAVLLDWSWDSVDAGVPPDVAAAVAAALVRIGSVAFRWAGEAPWPADRAVVMRAPPRGMVRAALDRVTASGASDIVVTREADVVVDLFEHEWEMQGQAALVLEAGQGLVEALREALATRRSWVDFELARPALVLVTPAVDGDGILLAAGSEAVLHEVLEALREALADNGVALPEAS